LRATRTTSSRNSLGYGLGTATSFQAASQQARSGVTRPCSSPINPAGQWQFIAAATGLPIAQAHAELLAGPTTARSHA